TSNGQPDWLVSWIVLSPPHQVNDREVYSSEYVQLEMSPAWETDTVRPPMVIEPLREAVPVFWATEYATVPFPVPDAPEVMVIHGVVVAAVQLQPVWVVTATVPVPAAAVKLGELGET